MQDCINSQGRKGGQKVPVVDRGMQSRSYYSSMLTQGQHQRESNHNKQIGMMQSILSFPAKAHNKN